MRIFSVFVMILLCTNESLGQVNQYLRLLSKFWKISPSEHAKNKEGRSVLRGYVAKVRSAYKLALVECGNDSGYLDYILHLKWNERMLMDFQMDTSGNRERMIATLPRPLQTSNSPFPNDPYVVDSRFFEELFDLRASWATIFLYGNQELKQIFKKYKQLWMKRNRDSRNLLSEVIYLWYEIRLERIVSQVTEWEIRGVKMDAEDSGSREISSDNWPDAVLNLLSNDGNYQLRMFYHNLAIDSLLFYVLPVGTRLPNNIPLEQVDLMEAERNLTDASEKLDEYHGDDGMEKLGKVANRYLRAKAQKNRIHITTMLVRSVDDPSCSHSIVLENCGTDSELLSCLVEEILEQTYKSSVEGMDANQDNKDIYTTNKPQTTNPINDLLSDSVMEVLMPSCLNQYKGLDGDSKRQLSSVSNEKREVCKNKFNHYLNNCKEKIHQGLIKDPGALVSSYSTEVKDKKNLFLFCARDRVLHIIDSTVSVVNFLKPAVTSLLLLFVPSIAYHRNSEDMGRKTLSAIKKQCDNKYNCHVFIDIEKMSGHSSVLNLYLKISYECAPRGCNPNLYIEKTVKADDKTSLIWQCNSEEEGMLVTSVSWELKSGEWNALRDVFYRFTYQKEDSDVKTLEYLRDHCNGRNKCDKVADLKKITGVGTSSVVYVEVKYKCLPCKKFAWKKWMYNDYN